MRLLAHPYKPPAHGGITDQEILENERPHGQTRKDPECGKVGRVRGQR